MNDPHAIPATSPKMTLPTRPNRALPIYLLIFYAMFWTVLAIAPVDRFTWFLENLLVVVGLAFLIRAYRKQPLSNVSYVLVTAFFCLHTIGSHYTYSETPIGFWIGDLLGIERNHYDRIVHFGFGLLLCYPLHEFIAREAKPRGDWSLIFAVLVVASCSLAYELLEWAVAVIVSRDAAMAFLGTQGDHFDAHKDSALAVLGSIITAMAAHLVRKRRGIPGGDD